MTEQAIAEFNHINDNAQIKVQQKDPKTAAQMNSHRLTPKDLVDKVLLAKAHNRTVSRSKQFGGDTRARLKAKLQANLC